MAPSEDEHSVEALANRKVPITPPTDRIGPGARTGDLTIRMPSAAKHPIEGADELGVAIADEELDRARRLGSSIEGCGPAGSPTRRLGLAVTPAIRTRRVSWWMKMST